MQRVAQIHYKITKDLKSTRKDNQWSAREAQSGEITKKSVKNFDRHAEKLKMELMRLTGVEQALRGKVESFRLEVNSLQHENKNLLNQLKVERKREWFFHFQASSEFVVLYLLLAKSRTFIAD